MAAARTCSFSYSEVLRGMIVRAQKFKVSLGTKGYKWQVLDPKVYSVGKKT